MVVIDPLEKFPATICPIEVLKTIGENIILADSDYQIIWFNPTARNLLSKVGPLFDIPNVDSFIGLKMDHFHQNPSYQKSIMSQLTETHRTRINIKNTYVADIVVNPIKDNKNQDIKGYVVMLMDVTTKAQEEKRKDRLIKELSVPLLEIWDDIMAVPLIGPLNEDRFDHILTTLLKACQQNQTKYLVIDLTGLTVLGHVFVHQINKIINCLRIMGTVCHVAGINPELAYRLSGELNLDVSAFLSTKEALRHIISS